MKSPLFEPVQINVGSIREHDKNSRNNAANDNSKSKMQSLEGIVRSQLTCLT